MKKNMIPLFGIAFIVAIVSTGVFYGLFAGRLKSAEPEAPLQKTLVATHNLAQGTVMQASDVKIAEYHSKVSFHNALSKPEDAIGQNLMHAVEQGQPITEESLVGKAVRQIQPGMRAISIRVFDSVGLTPSLQPGSRVDLQAVAGKEGEANVRTFVQNIEVFSVDPQKDPTMAVVTLLASPEQSDRIAAAEAGGHLRLTLRNPADRELPPNPVVQFNSLFTGPKASYSAAHSAVAANEAKAEPRERP